MASKESKRTHLTVSVRCLCEEHDDGIEVYRREDVANCITGKVCWHHVASEGSCVLFKLADEEFDIEEVRETLRIVSSEMRECLAFDLGDGWVDRHKGMELICVNNDINGDEIDVSAETILNLVQHVIKDEWDEIVENDCGESISVRDSRILTPDRALQILRDAVEEAEHGRYEKKRKIVKQKLADLAAAAASSSSTD